MIAGSSLGLRPRSAGPSAGAGSTMETLVMKSGGWLLAALLAMLAVAVSADFGFSVHMTIVALAALAAMAVTLRRADYTGASVKAADQSRYDDDPVRWGVIATIFWG